MTRKLKYILLFLFLIDYHAIALDSNNYLGINYSFHRFFNFADFKNIYNVPNCCPRFENGHSNNSSLSIFYRTHLEQNFNIQIDLRYQLFTANFSAIEPETFGTEDGFINGEFLHNFDTDINSIALIPSISYNYNSFIFNLGLGFNYLWNQKYSQKESIITPNDRGTFIDSTGKDTGSRIRNQNSGKFNELNKNLLTVLPRISYQLKLDKDKKFILEPQIGAELNIFEISDELNWKSFNIFGGLSFVVQINRESSPRFDTIPSSNTIELANLNDSLQKEFEHKFSPIYIIPNDTLISIMDVPSNIDDNYRQGQTQIEYDTVIITKKLTIRKTNIRYDTLTYNTNKEYLKFDIVDQSNTRPKLNKIILNEYISKTELYNFNKIYLNESNIDNNKLTFEKYPIYINYFENLKVNYTKNKQNININLPQIRNESNTQLQQRLDLIRSFLMNELNIEYNDIIFNIDTSQKINNEDNYFEIDNYIDQSQILVIDTLRSFDIEDLNIKINYKINNIVSKLNLKIYDQISLIKTIDLDTSFKTQKLKLNDIISQITNVSNILKFRLEATTITNDTFSNEQILKIQYNTYEKQKLLSQNINKKYKKVIILFDKNSFTVNEKNIKILNKIDEEINNKTTLILNGYTDDTGKSNFNYILSLNRANEVAKYLTKGVKKIYGLGISNKFQTDNHELNHSLSRSVEIIYSIEK